MGNITIKQGDTEKVKVNVIENNAAFNLEGYTAKMFVEDEEIAGEIDNAASGEIVFDLDHNFTKDKDGDYDYEVKIYKDDKSDIKTILDGTISISEVMIVLE
jgi:hypothetical protein